MNANHLRWMTVVVVSAGTVLSVLNSTMVNVALPDIADALDAEGNVEWVVSVYLLAVSVVLPVTGWLGDRFGHKRMYLVGLSGFTLGSLLCAISPTFPLLVAARAFQGVGGGIVLPIGLVLILKVFPREEHGKALGVWGIAAMASPAIGPTLGGWLVDTVDWNFLFLITVPIGVAVVLAGWRFLPTITRGRLGRFDTVGFLTGSVGLAAFVLGLSEGNRWGWDSPATLACILGGLGLLVLFVVNELHVRDPMLELRMFRSITFTLTFCITFVVIGAQYIRLVFVPLELEAVAGYSALAVGLSLAPAAIFTAIGVSLGGRVSDRIGPRPPILIGIITMVVTGFAVASFGLRAPLWVLVTLLSLQGFGLGLHQAPTTVVAMNTLPGDLVGQGATVRNLASMVSGAVVVAGLGALLSIATPTNPTSDQVRHGFEVVFYACALGLVVALVMALFLRPTERVAESRADEEELKVLEKETAVASLD